MVFQGQVTLSLYRKDAHEYFTLYRSNYIGDYQIMLNLRASEFYKSTADCTTFCYCLAKADLEELILTFPDAKAIFLCRAQARRIEFRRIKKLYEIEANINHNLVQDAKEIQDKTKFEVRLYNDMSKVEDMPPFLRDSQYWFSLTNFGQSINQENLEEYSDSEVHNIEDESNIVEETTLHTLKSLKNLIVSIYNLPNKCCVETS